MANSWDADAHLRGVGVQTTPFHHLLKPTRGNQQSLPKRHGSQSPLCQLHKHTRCLARSAGGGALIDDEEAERTKWQSSGGALAERVSERDVGPVARRGDVRGGAGAGDGAGRAAPRNDGPQCATCTLGKADGAGATLWNRRDTTRRASLAGLAMHCSAWLAQTEVTVLDGGWIRTDAWVLPPLRLLAHTYWLCRVDADEMLRLVYDASGAVVFQYRMRRVARDAHTRTRHHAEWRRACEGARYLVAL